MEIELTPELLHILQHSLGVDRYGQGEQYRNHYVAGGNDVERCRTLVAQGYMREQPGGQLTGGMPVFSVTAAGIDAVALQSETPPKLTRSQKRYRDYLEVAECYEDFKHYLQYAKYTA